MKQDRRPGVVTSGGSCTGRVPPARPVPRDSRPSSRRVRISAWPSSPRPDRTSPRRPTRRRVSAAGARPPGVVTDHLFRWLALAAGCWCWSILGLIAYSTTKKRGRGSAKEGLGIFADNWDPAQGHFGAGAMIYGTFLVGLIALVIAVPVSIGIALFVTEIAPRRLRKPVIYTVDLLAAIPSVVYGLWALARADASRSPTSTRASRRRPAASRSSKTLFAEPSETGLSYMTAGIVVAIMITPIITSMTREVFATTPAAAEGSGVRARRDAVGDDPRRGVPAQPRRRGRRR